MRDQTTRNMIRNAINAAIRSIATTAGCEGKLLHMTQSDDALCYVIKFGTGAALAADVVQVLTTVGLPEDTIGRTYEKDGHTFTVIDAVPRQFDAKIRVQREDGLMLIIGSQTLKYRLGLIEEEEVPPYDEDEVESSPTIH